MQQIKITTMMVMIFVGSGFVYADDVVIPGADLGKSVTLPPPPGNVAPQPDPGANAQIQPQAGPAANPDALTRPVPGYRGGPYVQGGNQYWLPNNVVPQVGSPYYYSATQGSGGTYGMAGPNVGIRAGQTWFGGHNEANTGMQNQELSSDPYTRHFGPGFYRSNEYGHLRFPSYSYRRPWYNPGAPTYNRDTNYRW
ncbi:hypothetical protein [uncultured Gimesia sp.]|uniref:hypothetical protein n=1 Tax=uncultured Gimesia sp. TaxID=1678688 RepID=UPI0030DAA0F5|tara:strand:- start:262479 stop:263066 length:588 start_codon:yes stop_codon:yes gene_type:complete